MIKEPLRLRNMWSYATDSAVVLDSAVNLIGIYLHDKERVRRGTGFLTAPRIVVTANHVCDIMRNVHITKHGVKDIAFIEETIQYKHVDVAVIYLDRDMPGPYAKICERDAVDGERVIFPNIRAMRGKGLENIIRKARTQRLPDFYNRGTVAGNGCTSHVRNAKSFNMLSRRGNSGSAIFERATNTVISIACTGNGNNFVPYVEEETMGPQTKDLRSAVEDAVQYLNEKYGANQIALPTGVSAPAQGR